MQFSKMHGAGNDYVYVNCFDEPVPADPSTLAQQVSRRRFGVGADGLVLILPTSDADAEMRMFNADGSESEMCGNALRCVAWLIHDRGLVGHKQISLQTGRGLLRAAIESHSGSVGRVRVEMGAPIFDAERIPTRLNPPWPATLHVDQAGYSVTAVSMGNPHCVLFCPHAESAPVTTLGPEIEVHPVFPQRTNVEFVQVAAPDRLVLRVWERGSGETLACGTGACAAVAAGVVTGRSQRRATVQLRGGTLEVDWTDETMWLTGPVEEVYRGDWAEARS